MKLRFKNGKIRIMQVSDPQDLQFVRHTMVRMLNKAYDMLKPDFVVLTGDNILGNHLCDARIGSKKVIHDKEGEAEAMKVAIDKIVSPIEKRGIPFAMIYGNHDDMNRITKDEQADMYRKYKCCIGLDDENSPDVATYNVPVYSEKSDEIKFNIWMLDSAWKDKELDKCFCMVKPQTVEWYKKKSAMLKGKNGGVPIPSLMFQHIPMAETLELIEECPESDKGAVKGPDGKFFKLKKDCKGSIEEYPSVVTSENGQFAAMKECGDIKAVVFGHDHPNCFEGVVDGINFVQTSCASFRCYGSRNRGVRIFDIDEKTGDFETRFYTYKDLMGDGILNEIAYIWDADGMIKQKCALIGGTAVALGLALSFIIALLT